MFITEVRNLTTEELEDKLEDLKESMYKLRINHATGELKDTSQFQKTKKDIARIMTVLRERELAAQIAEEEAQND